MRLAGGDFENGHVVFVCGRGEAGAIGAESQELEAVRVADVSDQAVGCRVPDLDRRVINAPNRRGKRAPSGLNSAPHPRASTTLA